MKLKHHRRFLSQFLAASTITIDVAACIRQTCIGVALIILAIQAPQICVGGILGHTILTALKRIPP
jgi:hypothetical protein